MKNKTITVSSEEFWTFHGARRAIEAVYELVPTDDEVGSNVSTLLSGPIIQLSELSDTWEKRLKAAPEQPAEGGAS